jgi:RNA polymerase sigma-70 factor (ECF subfamily)
MAPMSHTDDATRKPNVGLWSIRYDNMARGASLHRSDADGELVARARAGDADAYEQLLRRHSDGAHRVVWAILRNPELAEDALQECFVETYASLHRFDSRRPFGPWIKGIAVRCALAASRKQRRADNMPSQPAVSVEDPAATVARSDLQTAVREAIMALPERQRVAIRLFALENSSVAEVAKIMGCAVGTVKAHLHRARETLRGLLADRLEENGDEV